MVRASKRGVIPLSVGFGATFRLERAAHALRWADAPIGRRSTAGLEPGGHRRPYADLSLVEPGHEPGDRRARASSSSSCSSPRRRGCGWRSRRRSRRCLPSTSFSFRRSAPSRSRIRRTGSRCSRSWRSASSRATCRRWRARARSEAVARRDELARLFDLSRDVLLITDSDRGERVARRLRLAPVRSRLRWPIAVPRGTELGHRIEAGSEPLDARAVASSRRRTGTRRRCEAQRLTTGRFGGGGAARAAAARHASRLACSRLPGGRSNPARSTRLPASPPSRSSARSSSTSARRRSWRAAERGAEIRAAGLARPRPAHAAHRDSRRRQQPPGVVAGRAGAP